LLIHPESKSFPISKGTVFHAWHAFAAHSGDIRTGVWAAACGASPKQAAPASERSIIVIPKNERGTSLSLD
jgi:hypothetical protein